MQCRSGIFEAQKHILPLQEINHVFSAHRTVNRTPVSCKKKYQFIVYRGKMAVCPENFKNL